MSTALELALFAILAGLLAVVSAVAGACWSRARSVPTLRATLLARDLVERLRVLDGLIERLEVVEASRARATAEPRRPEPPGSDPPRPPRIGPALRIDASEPSEHAPAPDPAPSDPGPRPGSAPRSTPPAPTLITVPDLTAAGVPSAMADELAERFGAVWSRADRGESADAIARESGLPIGQVELILGLRRRTVAGGRPGF